MSDLRNTRYSIKVKRPIPFMTAMIDAFEGNGLISFEGDLSHLKEDNLTGISRERTACLRSQTLIEYVPGEPPHFVVIPLNANNAKEIRERILPTIGIRHRVRHVSIEKEGVLQFYSSDCFSEDQVFLRTTYPEDLLNDLKKRKVIESFKLDPDEWHEPNRA